VCSKINTYGKTQIGMVIEASRSWYWYVPVNMCLQEMNKHSSIEDLHSEQQVHERFVMADMKSLMIQGKATGQYFQININRINLHIFHFILNEVMMAAMRQKRNYRLPSYKDRCC
jgi:hypothetical protein